MLFRSAAIDINRFTGFKSNGDSIQLSIDPATNPFRYAYPKLPDYFNDDMIKDTVLSINGSNSTFSEFLSFLPSNLQYNMIASSNPDGEGVNYNFLTDESRIDVDFEFLLPFWFKADSFALEDTMDMDLSNISEDLDIIDKITVTLEVSNGLPLDIDFQIYFLDSLYNPVDTLFAENSRPVISSGIIGVDNTVIAPGVKTTSVTLLNSDIMNLETVRYAAMRAGLKTPTIDNVLTDVKIYNDYKVDFTMSVGVDIKANSNDF